MREVDRRRTARGSVEPVDALRWEGDVPELRSPALICAFAGALFAPATAALKGLDFGLIPTMLWGFMAGMAAYPGVVLPQAAQPEDEPAG